jgi:hypothetical protein
VLQVMMNAESEQAVAWLAEPGRVVELELRKSEAGVILENPDVHWRWRLQAAEAIAAQLDPQRFGVKTLYVFGSASSAAAGPESDIDLLVHFQGNPTQRQELLAWLDGWSLRAEVNSSAPVTSPGCGCTSFDESAAPVCHKSVPDGAARPWQ